MVQRLRSVLWAVLVFFFFNATATAEIYTLSLHDALPIYCSRVQDAYCLRCMPQVHGAVRDVLRSEEHTSELQSRSDLVCRLLLEKKKGTNGCCRLDSGNFCGRFLTCGRSHLDSTGFLYLC